MTAIQHKFSLQGRKALITGAAGYLGQAIAIALADAGAHVILHVRSLERGSSLLNQIQQRQGSAELLVLDICDEEQVQNYFAQTFTGPLHILVNNAYEGGGGNIETTNAEAYLDSYRITVLAAHNLLKHTLNSLRQGQQDAGDASVINIGSMYGMVSPDPRVYDTPQSTNPPFYGAAKAALLQWTRYAACEFGRQGIRVNSISPGPFPSLQTQDNDPAFVQRLIDKSPLGRIGSPEELAGPVLFLASPASTYVNGANLCVDGGWTAW